MLMEGDQGEIHPSFQQIHGEWKRKSGAYDGSYAWKMGQHLNQEKNHRESLLTLKKQRREEKMKKYYENENGYDHGK